MEAIAMRMTQREFDSIKGLLPKTTDISCFEERKYLVNNFRDVLGNISNLNYKEVESRERKIYEYFDKDIFLKACDIEVVKVWVGSEMQFFNGIEWEDCIGVNSKYRLKPQPDYSKEIESLQEKAKLNGMKAIVTFEKI